MTRPRDDRFWLGVAAAIVGNTLGTIAFWLCQGLLQ
jgi:hypothetical protein